MSFGNNLHTQEPTEKESSKFSLQSYRNTDEGEGARTYNEKELLDQLGVKKPQPVFKRFDSFGGEDKRIPVSMSLDDLSASSLDVNKVDPDFGTER